MQTWRSIEMVYGRAYMTRLRRRILLTTLSAFVLGVGLGWWLHG